MELVADQAEEQLVAEWTEPAISLPASKRRTTLTVCAGVGLAVLMSLFGYFIKDSVYYFASVASIVGSAAIALQRRRPFEPLQVSLTTLRLLVGRKEYDLDTLAGFWLSVEDESTVINIEPAKASMFPVSFRFPGFAEEAHQILSTQLREVEPRKADLSDVINRYIKF